MFNLGRYAEVDGSSTFLQSQISKFITECGVKRLSIS